MSDFGLIGKSLSHSFSRSFFEEKFRSAGLRHRYHNFELESLEQFPFLIRDYPELKGLNVTIPYKEEIIEFLDDVDPVVEKIGAVNTIKIINAGNRKILKGYNTDVIGFEKSLLPYLAQVKISNALVLGSGGAAKAVKYVLEKLGIPSVTVSGKPSVNTITYESLTREMIRNVQLIVNCTPLGKYPDIELYPPIPYEYIEPGTLAYDLNYNPAQTEFLRRAKARKCIDSNGVEMLYSQAEASWNIWNT